MGLRRRPGARLRARAIWIVLVDRMLVQLRQAGCLDGVAGIAFGYSPTCERDAPGKASLTLHEALRDLLAPLGVPLVYGLPFGHTQPHQWTLPLGCLAELDATAGTLTVLEPACALPHDWHD